MTQHFSHSKLHLHTKRPVRNARELDAEIERLHQRSKEIESSLDTNIDLVKSKWGSMMFNSLFREGSLTRDVMLGVTSGIAGKGRLAGVAFKILDTVAEKTTDLIDAYIAKKKKKKAKKQLEELKDWAEDKAESSLPDGKND
jgi:hypothetical protein